MDQKPKVFFARIDSYSKIKEISAAGAKLLELLEKENPALKFKGEVPLKVHFGEKGNETFIKPANFEGIISRLKNNGAKPFFTDTNVLYKGERTFSDTHIMLAKEHGFTALPIKIADGNHGEENIEIDISKSGAKHFTKCKIGKVIAEAKQMVVIAHFKGHMLAGFGGAVKQLSMGCAARAGKLAMHTDAKPMINPDACKRCHMCARNCPTDACIIDVAIPHIDKEKCIGCAMCIAVCPYKAVDVNWMDTPPDSFEEKLAEHALAAALNPDGSRKRVAYISFAFNLTKDCDCDGKKMTPIAKDIGVIASTDPVALDSACLDLVRKQEGERVFSGDHALEHAEKIGLGNRTYELIEV
ncbi:MAG: DUF362 domain-containing protein [archaeon]